MQNLRDLSRFDFIIGTIAKNQDCAMVRGVSKLCQLRDMET